MGFEGSEAITAYLESIGRPGLPSQKEMDCLGAHQGVGGCDAVYKRDEKCGGGVLTAPAAAVVGCRGYGMKLTPLACIENQLSPMCLPGWPCEECEMAVTIEIPPMRPMARVGEIGAEVGRPGRDPAVMMSSFSGPSGEPSLKMVKTRRKSKTGVWDPKTMSRAVARDLGLI